MVKCYKNCFSQVELVGRVNTGTSYTLFTPNNAPKVKDLVSLLTEAKQVVKPKLQELVVFRGRGGGRGRGHMNCFFRKSRLFKIIN